MLGQSQFNSLTPGIYGGNFKSTGSKFDLQNALRWMSQNLTYEK